MYRITALDDNPDLCSTWQLPTLAQAQEFARTLIALEWEVSYNDLPPQPAKLRVEISGEDLQGTLTYTQE